jgi:nucleoside-diphosphate-sugar epimerase
MKILLTGATGFVGSHVARVLASANCETFALVRPGASLWKIADVASKLTLIHADIFENDAAEQLAALKVDVCLHAAWYANPADYLDSTVNLDSMAATLRLAQRLGQAGCRRFVGVGSCFEYDTSLGYLSEQSPLAPRRLYSACKVGTWHALEQIGQLSGMSVAWARLFYLYGPFEDSRRLVPAVVQKLVAGKAVDVTPGGQVRDFLHVDDVASALWAVATSKLQGPINVASGSPVTVSNIVTRLGEIVGRPDLVRLGALPYRQGDPMFICANSRRLAEECQWTPRFSLDSGLWHAVEWWRQSAPQNSQ